MYFFYTTNKSKIYSWCTQLLRRRSIYYSLLNTRPTHSLVRSRLVINKIFFCLVHAKVQVLDQLKGLAALLPGLYIIKAHGLLKVLIICHRFTRHKAFYYYFSTH